MATEQTPLTPDEERAFQTWARANGIQDVDRPGSRYDYRGFWKATQGAPHPPGSEQHFPDTFKQHGHPTFSQESQYSAGPWDGGRWAGEQFVPPGAQFLQRSGGSTDSAQLGPALLALLQQMRGG